MLDKYTAGNSNNTLLLPDCVLVALKMLTMNLHALLQFFMVL